MPIIGSTRSDYFSCYGAIVRGSPNCIDSGCGAVGHNSCYGFIGGGSGNTICAGTCWSSILGGTGNTNSASYSAILGGINNIIPATMPNSAVFGNGISAVSPDTFHLSCLNAVNTPIAGFYPSGTVMWKNIGLINPTDRILVIHS